MNRTNEGKKKLFNKRITHTGAVSQEREKNGFFLMSVTHVSIFSAFVPRVLNFMMICG